MLLGLVLGLFLLALMFGRMVAWCVMRSLASVVGSAGVFALASAASWFPCSWRHLDLLSLMRVLELNDDGSVFLFQSLYKRCSVLNFGAGEEGGILLPFKPPDRCILELIMLMLSDISVALLPIKIWRGIFSSWLMVMCLDVFDARRAVTACRVWYPAIRDLHRFFIAIARVIVNDDGKGGTAPDPFVWCSGARGKRLRVVAGPQRLWVGGWQEWPDIIVSGNDVGRWPFSVSRPMMLLVLNTTDFTSRFQSLFKQSSGLSNLYTVGLTTPM